ncbi:hypothetical protein CRT60_08665 [Azospirillum palustre]|uniref:KilA-N domain-containing protein n=2 Tax=Azospirillum palustre TaxID=2044885 RepID=A0A2B8BJU4_9PROT|nr:hypothetical protein CRT60_08665 [Azospirillum palustre]
MGAEPPHVQNSSGTIPTVIDRQFNGKVIGQRLADGYLNLTAMGKATGKQPSHYLENAGTAAFLDELSLSLGIPRDSLIISKPGRPGRGGGTWGHPQVGYHFAQWCSPAFAVQVTEWIHDIRTKGFVAASGMTIQPPVAAPRLRSQSHSSMFRDLQRTYQNAGLLLTDAANAANRAVLSLTGIDILAAGGIVLSGAPPAPPHDVPALAAPDHPRYLTVTNIGVEIGVRTGTALKARAVNQALKDHGFQVKGGTTATPWMPTEKGKPYAKFVEAEKSGEHGGTANHLTWKWEVIGELLTAMNAS